MTYETSIRPGFYLRDVPLTRDQYRDPRRDPLQPVIVVHSTESGPRSLADNVAAFIAGRTDAGSYHIIGDRRGRIVPLVRPTAEAYGDRTGSNRFALHISGCMNAAEWGDLDPTEGEGADLVETYARMAAIAAGWCVAHGLQSPRAVLLTKQQSDHPSASGFISHGRRDPARRTDPGAEFPWELFFRRYSELTGAPTMPTEADRSDLVAQWQRTLILEGYATPWWDPDAGDDARVHPDDADRYADGDFGPATLSDSLDFAADAVTVQPDVDPDHARKAALFDDVMATARRIREEW